MFVRIKNWIKRHLVTDAASKQKRAVKKILSDIGFNWHDFENVLFWKDPWISLFILTIYTAFFWKFIAYQLQRFALLIILTSSSTLIDSIQIRMKTYITEQLGCVVVEENRTLGFDMDDVCEIIGNMWIILDGHYKWLHQMKHDKNPLLIFTLVAYCSFFILFFSYVPVVNLFFFLGLFAYFLPILNYLGFLDKLEEKCMRLTRPLLIHWHHNQTKRTRNKYLKEDQVKATKTKTLPPKHDTDLEDIENDQFLPNKSFHNYRVMNNARASESMNESCDEFDLHANFYNYDHNDSSDYDESSFMPSAFAGPAGMPSLSHYDSLMEPIDDEFHAGLDFYNENPTLNSGFGMPNQSDTDGNATDEDIEDIPVEQTDGIKFASISTYNDGGIAVSSIVENTSQTFNICDEPEYEFLNRTELNNVTDEEIINQVSNPPSKSIRQGVSNYLGY